MQPTQTPKYLQRGWHVEQERNHHVICRSRSLDWWTDHKDMTLRHRIRKTKSHFRLPLVTRWKPQCWLENGWNTRTQSAWNPYLFSRVQVYSGMGMGTCHITSLSSHHLSLNAATNTSTYLHSTTTNDDRHDNATRHSEHHHYTYNNTTAEWGWPSVCGWNKVDINNLAPIILCSDRHLAQSLALNHCPSILESIQMRLCFI